MELNPVVRIILTILAGANGAALLVPGLPPVVYTICTILNAGFLAVGVGVNVQSQKALRGARAENLALQKSLQGGAP